MVQIFLILCDAKVGGAWKQGTYWRGVLLLMFQPRDEVDVDH